MSAHWRIACIDGRQKKQTSRKEKNPMMRVAGVSSFVGVLLVASVSSAPAVSIHSSSTETVCIAGPSACGPSAAVNLVPDPAWTPPLGSSSWVSFANTVVPGGTAAPNTTIALGPTAKFTDTFTTTYGPGETLSLRVLADDTAQVKLDGVNIGPAPNSTLGSACTTGGGITCTGSGTLISALLAPGSHTLEFDVFQLADDSFGLDYSGVTATPEPASILLVGSALAAVGAFSRRRWQRK